MKTVSIFYDYGALNSKPVLTAFETGLKLHGIKTYKNSLEADAAVIWSMLWHGRMSGNRTVYEHYRKLGKPVFIVEVGGIHRNITWRVGLNGLGRESLLRYPSFIKRTHHFNIKLNPWRSGDNILICCQNGNSELWSNMPPVEHWVSDVIYKIREVTDRPLIVRQHPRFPLKFNGTYKNVSFQKPILIKNTYDSYNLSFENIHATVCWNSTPAPQSVIDGVPVFTSINGIAYPVGNTDLSLIETPNTPDREEWLTDYISTEFTLAEIEQGMPLKTLTNI